MAVMHLPIKFSADIFMQSGVIDIFPKFTMAEAAILDCQVTWIWPFRRVDSVVLVLCTKFGSNICYCHWDRRTYPSDIHLMTSPTRINFRFRLLVTCSSPHGCDAFSHKTWWRYLYLIRSYRHFPEIKDGGRRHLGFVGGAMGPPTKAYSWSVLPVKISS